LGCSDLSERLNLSRDEGEKWIVNLIRETRMGADAKIDLEKVCLLALSHYFLSPPVFAQYSMHFLNRT